MKNEEAANARFLILHSKFEIRNSDVLDDDEKAANAMILHSSFFIRNSDVLDDGRDPAR